MILDEIMPEQFEEVLDNNGEDNNIAPIDFTMQDTIDGTHLDVLLNGNDFNILESILFCENQADFNLASTNLCSEQNEWNEEFLDFFRLENENSNDTF